MALPAGRRGIRANLVKSDGTISDLTKLKDYVASLNAMDIETSSGVVVKETNGNPVTIANALQAAAVGIIATLEPIQSGSGTPSPTNIRPITGRTQIEISNKDSEDVEQASATVDLGQTVYGGTLNVTTGELIVNKGYVDLGTLNWTKFGNLSIFVSDMVSNLKSDSQNLISSIYSFNGVSIPPNRNDKTINSSSYFGNKTISVYDVSYTDAASFKTAMSGVQLVYELNTPQTIQLTPAQLSLFTTVNIISTNADNLAIRYYATGKSNVEVALTYLFDRLNELSAQINE